MANYGRTFRKSGSHQAESSAIDGVEVKIGEKFRPPKKVTLPVGWHQRDPSDVLSLTYDFSLEKEIIKKAEEEKAKKALQEAATVAETSLAATCMQSETQPSTSVGTETVSKPQPMFPNVGTDILTPVTVTGSGHKRADSMGGKGTNAINISDFEGDTSTPFELVELQTINDMDELKSVLETTMGGQTPQPTADLFTVTAASSGAGVSSSPSVADAGNLDLAKSHCLANTSGNMPASISTVAQHTNFDAAVTSVASDTSGNTLVDISEPRVAMPNEQVDLAANSSFRVSNSLGQRPVPPQHVSQTQPFSALQPRGDSIQNSTLVDVGKPDQAGRVPASCSPPVSGAALNSSPVSQAQPTPSCSHLERGMTHLPPLQSPPQIPPRPWVVQAASGGSSSMDRAKLTGGVRVLPSNMGQLPYPAAASAIPPAQRNLVSSPLPVEESLPSLDQRPSPPSPLPPIGSRQPEPASSLPDPWPVLNDSEKALVTTIASMGFPAARVARAVQKLGDKDREIVDFLVAVDEISQLGYLSDDAEVALTLNDMDKEKATKFLDLEKVFREWGFKQSHIQEALRAAGNDRDKALDYLTTLAA